MATIETHTRGDGSTWLAVLWCGHAEEVFDGTEASDAQAYAEALRAYGGPMFYDQEEAS